MSGQPTLPPKPTHPPQKNIRPFKDLFHSLKLTYPLKMAVFNRNLQTSKGLYGLFSGALAVSFREGNQLVWGVDQP